MHSCWWRGSWEFSNYNETTIDSKDFAAPTNAQFTGCLSSSVSFGAKVRLGYTLSPQSIFFLGIGAEYSSTTLKSQRYGGVSGDAVAKKTKKGLSFAPLVGVDVFVNDKFFVRAEYTYVFPINITQQHQFNDGNSRTATFKAKLNQSRFTLGVGYKF